MKKRTLPLIHGPSALRTPHSAILPPSAIRTPQSAILLLGPTGSGKTPLGELLENTGLWGRECRHFDFGASLRKLGAIKNPPKVFTREDIAVVRRVLASGALLRDNQFHIALKVLGSFLSGVKAKDEHDLIVLNGLPRHVGQAQGLAALLDVVIVVNLRCNRESAHARVRLNTGKDRTGRVDDTRDAVAKRLDIFEKMTLPLIDYYRRRNIRVATISTGPQTDADAIRSKLEALQT